MNALAQAQDPAAAVFVVTRVGERDLAIPIDDVRQVVPMVAITPVTGAPAWVAGIVDLRGEVVPVIDLRIRMDVSGPPPGLGTPIVFCASAERTFGVIVDEVVGIEELETIAASRFGDGDAASLTAGFARGERGIVLVASPDAVAGSIGDVPGVSA